MRSTASLGNGGKENGSGENDDDGGGTMKLCWRCVDVVLCAAAATSVDDDDGWKPVGLNIIIIQKRIAIVEAAGRGQMLLLLLVELGKNRWRVKMKLFRGVLRKGLRKLIEFLL